jgi:hypothetical protein
MSWLRHKESKPGIDAAGFATMLAREHMAARTGNTLPAQSAADRPNRGDAAWKGPHASRVFDARPRASRTCPETAQGSEPYRQRRSQAALGPQKRPLRGARCDRPTQAAGRASLSTKSRGAKELEVNQSGQVRGAIAAGRCRLLEGVKPAGSNRSALFGT